MIKTYGEFESFVPKNLEGRKEELQKIRERKLGPYMESLKKTLAELNLPFISVNDVEVRETPSKKEVFVVIINKTRIGKTNYEEFLKVTITDSSTKDAKKFRINVTKEMNNANSYSPNHLDANLATFEFAKDGNILNRRLNG